MRAFTTIALASLLAWPIVVATPGAMVAVASDCDVAILGGRVMDPETRFDAVRNICVRDGKIT